MKMKTTKYLKQMKAKTKTSFYESPLVLEEVLHIEQGFAQSNFGKANEAGSVLTENDKYSYEF